MTWRTIFFSTSEELAEKKRTLNAYFCLTFGFALYLLLCKKQVDQTSSFPHASLGGITEIASLLWIVQEQMCCTDNESQLHGRTCILIWEPQKLTLMLKNVDQGEWERGLYLYPCVRTVSHAPDRSSVQNEETQAVEVCSLGSVIPPASLNTLVHLLVLVRAWHRKPLKWAKGRTGQANEWLRTITFKTHLSKGITEWRNEAWWFLKMAAGFLIPLSVDPDTPTVCTGKRQDLAMTVLLLITHEAVPGFSNFFKFIASNISQTADGRIKIHHYQKLFLKINPQAQCWVPCKEELSRISLPLVKSPIISSNR